MNVRNLIVALIALFVLVQLVWCDHDPEKRERRRQRKEGRDIELK